MVSHIDLIPTMLDYLGINPKKYKLPGVSYKKLFDKPTASVQEEVKMQWFFLILIHILTQARPHSG